MRRRLLLPHVLVTCALMLAALPAGTSVAAWNQEPVLTAGADGKQFDSFGWSVAVSGDTAIVGANSDDVTSLRSGSAYVFVRSGATWTRQARLTASDATLRDLFGHAVAISGDAAVVGALRSNGNRGSAYVFVRSGTAWSEQGILEPDIDVTGDQCGFSVAVSGDTAVLGCKNDAQGAVYVFVRNGTTWSRQATLTASNSGPGDFFGWSVAVSGGTIVVGAINDALGGAQPKGSATVFVRSGATWTLQQKLVAADGMALDAFGIAVAISGGTAVVGAVSADTTNHPLRQTAYVFARGGTVWTQQDTLRASDAMAFDGFGTKVAISADVVLVGAPGDDVGAAPGTNEGAAYLFGRTNGAWSEIQKLAASDAAPGARFGFAVGLSGSRAVVGAPERKVGANFSQGQAYPFVNPDTDGDGLPDEWETAGTTIDGVFVDLPAMGADPRHKDVFAHVDWMAGDPGRPAVVFKPAARALKTMIDAFAVAPVANPNGKKGIHLHLDAGPTSIMNPVTGAQWGALSRAGSVPYQAVVGSVDAMSDFDWTSIDAVKLVHFAPSKRASAFHYALVANDYAGSGGSSGLSRGVPGSDLLMTLGTWPTPGGTVLQQAGTLMHELGHNLGLRHGGFEDANLKPNYVSIMNYVFQLTGLLRPGRQRRMDYSAFALAPLDETALDEVAGIAHPASYLTLWSRFARPTSPAGSNKCVTNPSAYHRLFLPSPGLDWDCDGVKSVMPTAADVNGDGFCVGPGPNGIADTAIAGVPGDDDLRGLTLWTGPNRTCDTAAVGDDAQLNPVGYVEPVVLSGFDDWPALVFTGSGRIGSAPGSMIGDPAITPIDEPTLAEMLDAVPAELLDEEPPAPLDVVTVSTQEGPAPLAVEFDGSGSTAGAGGVASWTWDFGDGGVGTGANPSHIYDTPGEYFASLTVTDGDGNPNLVPLLTRITVTDATVPTPTPTPTVAPLAGDHFLGYAAQTSKDTPKLVKLGPVTLDDGFAAGDYDVVKRATLAVPAARDGGTVADPATALAQYTLKPSKGSPKRGAREVRVVDACGEVVVTASKPAALLLPSALAPSGPVAAPNDGDHVVDHFLCHQAKSRTVRKGAQVDVADRFQTRRYDLKKIVALCHPTSVTGTPRLLSGPDKGTLLPLTPAAIRRPTVHVLCYQVTVAKKTIVQSGCGPATAKDKGTAIVPTPGKHVPRVGLFVADRLGAARLDTKKEAILCMPAALLSP